MNKWILARGRAAETTLPDVTPAGARVIALSGAAASFAPPQPLFISETDGAETEWLGRVTQATTSSLAFSRPVRASKNSGARLWSPASMLEFPPDAAVPERRETHTGVAAERAAGGEFYAVQTAAPLTAFRLRFDDLAPATEDALLAWIAAQTLWGLSPFTLVTPEAALMSVRLAPEPVARERDARGRRTLTLPLLVEQEGAYQ